MAFLVLISHIDIRFYGLNPGVIAVVIFYLLAGFVVSHLLVDIIPVGKGQFFKFYQDRILRIFPLYLYVICLTTLFLLLTSFGNPHPSFIKVLNNLLIIPLNYFMVIDSTIITEPNWCLVPPAWSLGAELQAYILLPFAFASKRVKILLTLASFFVYMLANLSIVQPDYFGYRLIMGVFFIFIIGSSIHRNNSTKLKTADTFDKWLPLTVWIIIFLSLFIFAFTKSYSPAAYTKETFLGLLMGIPLVYVITQSKKKLPLNFLFGSLSYGIFLSHFLVIWFLEFLNITNKNSVGYIMILLLLSASISYMGVVVVEKKVSRIRLAIN